MYDKLIANSRNDNTHSAFRLFDKAGSGQITIDALKETYTEYDFIIDDSTAQVRARTDSRSTCVEKPAVALRSFFHSSGP